MEGKGIITREANIIENSIEVMKNYQVPAILLRGSAGTGKTTIAELYAEYTSAEKYFFQCVAGTGEDELLYTIIPDSNTKSGFKAVDGVLVKALNASKQRKVVVIIDEVDKTRPRCDAFFLDLIQNCRISLNNSEDTTISGDKNNLVIFFTSNDSREFSEPFLRRVVSIQTQPLEARMVFEILKKEFHEKIAVLLTQVYDDTIKAGLTKPATIQELRIAGKLLERGVDLDTVLNTVIVKYKEDWEKFQMYVSQREPYVDLMIDEKNENSIIKNYESSKEEILIGGEEERKEEEKKLPNVPRIRVKEPEKVEKMPEDYTNIDIEVYGKFENEDDKAYTQIIRNLQPEPTESPEEMGKFKLLKEYEKEFIVATKPMTIEECVKNLPRGRLYVEQQLVITKTKLNKLINEAYRIRYYTKNKIALEFNEEEKGEAKAIIELKETLKIDDEYYIASIKLAGSSSMVTSIAEILAYTRMEKTDRIEDGIIEVLHRFAEGRLKYIKIDNKKSYNFNFDDEGLTIGYNYAKNYITKTGCIEVIENPTLKQIREIILKCITK